MELLTKEQVEQKMFTRVETVQDLISKDIFEESKAPENDMLQILEFAKSNGVPLTDHQAEAFFLLSQFEETADIPLFMNALRPLMTPTKQYTQFIDKITLADRIKGSAKLSNLLKAQVASASAQVPASEMQPKALKEKELNR